MPGVAAILHAPALFLRIFLNVAAGSAGVSVVAATVVIGVVIVGKMTDPPHPGDDHFRDTTIILQSSASIAFNRIIQVYEMDVYYNATEALLDLSKRLNDHLKQKFPRMFVKAVTSGFSLKPQTDVSRRKRRYPYCHECLLKLLAENAAREKRDSSSVDHGVRDHLLYPPSIIGETSKATTTTTTTTITTTTTTTTTTTETTTTTTTTTTETTTTPAATSMIDDSSTETSAYIETDTIVTSISPETDSTTITGIVSTASASKSTNTISASSITASELLTTSNNINVSNCSLSTHNGTIKKSVIFINSTLYFNVTTFKDIDIASIIDALKSFNPIIELADKCIKKSPDTSSFNATLSKVEPPYKVEVDLSFLKEDNTIPPSLLSQANSIIPPIVIAENGTTTTTPTPTPTPTTATSTITTGTPVVG